MDYIKYKLSRRSLIEKAQRDCLREMYAKAQPSVDFDAVLAKDEELLKQGVKREDLPRVYEQCYLSIEECRYIVNKYAEAYGTVQEIEYKKDGGYNIISEFENTIDILIRDITKGYSKDKYIQAYTDANGNYHPGHKGYEDIPPLKNDIGEENVDKIVKFLEDRKNFYNTYSEYDYFGNLYLSSPNSNLEAVQRLYPDMKINPRHLTMDDFWEEEEYGHIIDDDDDFYNDED